MGLSLIGPDEGPTPRPVHLKLVCDGDNWQHRGIEITRIFTEGGYIQQRSDAVAAGWRFAGDGKTYGPCCGAKHAR